MSSTQEKRQSFDYRNEYFKHNKGLFGCIYFCAQCYRPLLRKDVEVDHIVPLSKMGPNSVLNCVATCRKCNRHKSDSLGKMTVKGLIFKIVEEVFIGLSKVIRYLLSTCWKSLMCPIKENKKVFSLIQIAIVYFLLIMIIFK